MADRVSQTVVDLTINAPIDMVWIALRDPAQIATWFGWDAPTLAEEIGFIFIDSATADGERHHIQFGEWEGASDAIALTEEGERTRLVVERVGGAPLDWAGRYDDMAEGWVTFFQQLRLALEHHAGQVRRTIYLSGASRSGVGAPSAELGLGDGAVRGTPGEAYAATLSTGDTVSGLVWYETHFQRGLTVEQWGHGLLVVTDMGVSPKRPHGGGSVLLTTYGMDDADFAALEARWTQWWNGRYEQPAA